MTSYRSEKANPTVTKKSTSCRPAGALWTFTWSPSVLCQIPAWIQNTVDRLQRTSWQGTYLHPRNDHPIKKQKIFHEIQWRTCPEGSKIQAWYFRQACIPSVWASGMELLAKGNVMKLKHSSETWRLIFLLNLWMSLLLQFDFEEFIVKRPRMLSAQFVAIYKPCKPKPMYVASLLMWHHTVRRGGCWWPGVYLAPGHFYKTWKVL